MATQTMPAARTSFLRRVLQADALICMGGGALLSAGSAALADAFGMPAPLLLGIGLFLIPWGGFIWYVASRPAISRRATWAIIILNTLWMIDSVILVVAGWLPLTTLGWWAWLIQGLAGGLIAELQYLGLRRA